MHFHNISKVLPVYFVRYFFAGSLGHPRCYIFLTPKCGESLGFVQSDRARTRRLEPCAVHDLNKG
ncbi:hypothetical protein E4T39_07403 [Aureobasidium subglaciale]|nr:hypothetical protein E4T39_07403 [Aureobasidium subglaciale]